MTTFGAVLRPSAIFINLLTLALTTGSFTAAAQTAPQKSTVLSVVPARIHTEDPSLTWLSLGLMNELSIGLWRSRMPRALPSNHSARPSLAHCTDLQWVCLSQLNDSAQSAIAQATGADYVVLPSASIGADHSLRLRLVLQAKDGVRVHELSATGTASDLRFASQALAQLLSEARAKVPAMLVDEASLHAIGTAKLVKPNALSAFAQITRNDWLIRFAPTPLTQEQDAAWEKKKLAAIQHAVELDSDYAPGWNDLAWSQLNAGNADAAAAAFARSKQLAPQGIGSAIGPAFVASQRPGQLSQAIALTQAVLTDYPQYGEIWGAWIAWLASDPASRALYQQQLTQAHRFLDSQALRFNLDLALNLAWQAYNADRNEEAQSLGVRVASEMQQLFSPQRVLLEPAWSRTNEVVARALVDLNKARDSLPYFEAAVTGLAALATHDAAHQSSRLPDVRVAWARALNSAKEPVLAHAQLAQAVQEFGRLPGDTLLPRVKALNLQARWFNLEKQYPRAQLSAQSVLALIGPDPKGDLSAEAIAGYRSLTVSLENQSKQGELGPVLAQRLALAKKTLKADDSEFAAIYRDMGDHAFASKAYQQAIDAFESDIAARRNGGAGAQSAIAFAYDRIARSNEALQRYDAALQASIRSSELRKSIFSTLSASTASTVAAKNQAIVNLSNSLRLKGNLLGELGRFQEALSDLEAVRALALQEQPVSIDRQAQAANAIGWALRKLDRNAQAIEQYELALRLWEQDGPKSRLAVATASANLGVSLNAIGRNAESLPLFERALAIRRELLPAQHEDIAHLLQNLASLLSDMDNNTLALQYAREAFAISSQLHGPDHISVLDVRERIASILNDMGNAKDAESEYLDILARREKAVGKQHRSYLDSLESLAGKLRQRGQNDRALTMIEEALAGNRRQYGLQHSRVASNLVIHAAALEGLGRYAEALSSRQAVLAINEAIFGQDSAAVARAKAKLGNLYLRLGDPARAESELEKALELIIKWGGDRSANTASILIESGDVLFRTNRKEKARERYERALAIHTELYGEDNVHVAKDLGYLAEYYLEKKDYARAMPMLERAHRIDSKLLGPMHTNTAASLNNLAANYYASGQEERSLPLVLRAALIAQSNGDPNSSATYLMNLARNYAYLEQRPAAIIFGKQAINMLQKIRMQSATMEASLQKSLLQSNLKSYRHVADLLTQEGRLAEAQEVLAMLKEEEYFEFIRRDASDKPVATLAKITPAEAPWLDRYQQIGNDIARIARELGELRQSGDIASPKVKALEADLAVANSGFDQITGDMFKAFKDNKARQLTSQKIEAQGALQETLAELGDGVSLVQYLVLPSRVGIIVTTSGVQIAREALVSEEDLNRKVAAYREAVFNPGVDPTVLAQELYQLLIAPISNDLAAAKTKVLMLSLDGTLRYLPFAALHDGERFLVEKTQLALYSDAARDKLKDRAQGTLRVWGMGLTKAVPGFSALSGVKTELDAIVSKEGIAGQIHFDEAFTEQTLHTGLAQKFPVLHIASHFKFSAGTEADSFLLLGDGSKLSLKDVRSRVRFSGVDLLTLSACETAFGGGQDANGREIEGFATLAQNRGAKSVLASLWPVSDASTSRLMQTLYRSRDKDRLNKAAALQKAQLSLLKGSELVNDSSAQDHWRGAMRASVNAANSDAKKLPAFKSNPSIPHAHPYYWAPFILMGNWL